MPPQPNRNRRKHRPILECLEPRCVPAVLQPQTFFDDTWHLVADNDNSNTISVGDTVDNRNSNSSQSGLTIVNYGTEAFGSVSTAFDGYAGTLGSADGFATIADAIDGTENDGTITIFEGIYVENIDLGQNGGTGKTLRGQATIQGTVNIPSGSRLAPGAPREDLTTGTVTFESGSFFRFQETNTQNRLFVNGAVNLNGATLEMVGEPDGGNLWTLIVNDGDDPVNGTFADLEEGDMVIRNGVVGFIRYAANFDPGGTTMTGGNDVVIDFGQAMGKYNARGFAGNPFAPQVRPGQGSAMRSGLISSSGEIDTYFFETPDDLLYRFELRPFDADSGFDGRFTVRDLETGDILLGPIDLSGPNGVETGTLFLQGKKVYSIEVEGTTGTSGLRNYRVEVFFNRSNIGAFDQGVFYLDTNGTYKYEPGIDQVSHFGQPGDQPVAGRFTPETEDRIGVYHNGEWYLDRNGNGNWDGPETDLFAFFGADPADQAVLGDWNGDGIHQIGVFRDGTWFLDLNGNGGWDAGDGGFSFGQAGDKPIVGDWNGDGIDDFGILRDTLFLLDADGSRGWNTAGDQGFVFSKFVPNVPTAGDWDGDGMGEVGVYRSVQNGTNLFQVDLTVGFVQVLAGYGAFGSIPVIGHWKEPDSLHAANPAPANPNPAFLTLDQVAPLLDQAIADWASTGLDAAAAARLHQAAFRIEDLPGSLLGLAFSNSIVLDIDAAGWGWFVDPTPDQDEEFSGAPDSPAGGRIDLLTALRHELGHLLGLPDREFSGHDAMEAALEPGLRRGV